MKVMADLTKKEMDQDWNVKSVAIIRLSSPLMKQFF